MHIPKLRINPFSQCLLVSALVPSQKFILSISLTSPSPLVVILSNSPKSTSIMQSTLLSLGRLKQQYKSQKHSNRSPTNPSLSRQCVDTSGELVWRQWWSRKSSFKHRKERMDFAIRHKDWTLEVAWTWDLLVALYWVLNPVLNVPPIRATFHWSGLLNWRAGNLKWFYKLLATSTVPDCWL